MGRRPHVDPQVRIVRGRGFEGPPGQGRTLHDPAAMCLLVVLAFRFEAHGAYTIVNSACYPFPIFMLGISFSCLLQHYIANSAGRFRTESYRERVPLISIYSGSQAIATTLLV